MDVTKQNEMAPLLMMTRPSGVGLNSPQVGLQRLVSFSSK